MRIVNQNGAFDIPLRLTVEEQRVNEQHIVRSYLLALYLHLSYVNRPRGSSGGRVERRLAGWGEFHLVRWVGNYSSLRMAADNLSGETVAD